MTSECINEAEAEAGAGGRAGGGGSHILSRGSMAAITAAISCSLKSSRNPLLLLQSLCKKIKLTVIKREVGLILYLGQRPPVRRAT